ncbi:rRNA processing protein [Rhodotorula toruloides]|uniref:rRNA processing protein n=1 Tax=Rhodotorula toruloides TaxID=5286 RepID=A0A511KM03_RHOTO|nr:rRNA processing protein [Rhodotorula toruloides]
MDIMARLHDVLQGAVKPMITQCCMQALYDAGAEAQPAVDAAKGFERRKCNHFKARPEDECMLAMAGTENKNRYVFATQSLPLRESLRAIPGSPIIYIARSVMLLESPSNQTLAKKRRMEESKLHVSAEELAVITGKPLSSADPVASKSAAPADDTAPVSEVAAEPPKKKKRKGPSGPNPLSVKKKKAKPADPIAGRRPKKREREEDGGDSREHKRQKEEDGKVVSLAARSDGGEKKKRRRRRKGAAAGADGEGGDVRGGGAGPGGEA